MLPLVTIVIPFYNCAYVQQAIHSALNQTYTNVEVIVVDDGSTSHADLVRPYIGRVHYLGKANGGTASALNHGIRYASGDYIAWLSSDDFFYADKIGIQLNYMLHHHAWISHSSFDYMDERSQITAYSAAPLFASALDFYRAFFSYNPVNGCTVMMKRELFSMIGAFNDTLPYTHDLDLWYRVILAGIDFHFINRPLIAYRRHSQMGTVKYRPAIELEVAATNGRYHGMLRQLIAKLG